MGVSFKMSTTTLFIAMHEFIKDGEALIITSFYAINDSGNSNGAFTANYKPLTKELCVIEAVKRVAPSIESGATLLVRLNDPALSYWIRNDSPKVGEYAEALGLTLNINSLNMAIPNRGVETLSILESKNRKLIAAFKDGSKTVRLTDV